ncbi:DUF6134 family protein [Paracoccaceae bacterium]|nr:DUF6134 family protein [Paracoccaceae bacterium]
MERRHFLISSFLSLGLISQKAYSSTPKTSMTFDVLLNDEKVGYSTLNHKKLKNSLEVLVDVEIMPQFLGLKFMKYTLKNREVWKKKKLISIDANSSWFGKRYYVKGQREKSGFRIEGSAFSGVIKDTFATTSYFTPEFLKRRIWVSTQDGTPLEIKTRKLKNKKVSFNDKNYSVTEWEISGDLNLTLQYDEQKNWVGSGFTVGNYPASFILNNRNINIHKIWKNS